MSEISRLKILRLIDANANRAKEGLRVCEDICRFYFDKKKETLTYKGLRHQLTKIMAQGILKEAIAYRQIQKDVGRTSTKSEFSRRNIQDVFFANSQRVKESLRVLEESAKLLDITAAKKFKSLRYAVYELESRFISIKL